MATPGVLSEAGTVPSVNYADTFFNDLPNDARFSNVQWAQIVPSSGLGQTIPNINFNLQKLAAPNVYILSDVLIEANILIMKEKNSALPDKLAQVGPGNANVIYFLLTNETNFK